MRHTVADDRHVPAQVWSQICRHCDGLAVGSTMAALAARGGLHLLAAGHTEFDDLRARLDARPGHLRVGVRLLADQGWVHLVEDRSGGTVTIEPTACGATVMTELVDGYRRAVEFLPTAERLDTVLFGPADRAGQRALERARDLMRAEWGLPKSTLPATALFQVVSHLDGHVVAPVMSVLTRHGVIRPDAAEFSLDDRMGRGGSPAVRTALEILAHQGWLVVDGRTVRLTAAGAAAAAAAGQYWYPTTYLRLLRQVPVLLFGDPGEVLPPGPSGMDDHLNRGLDIRFSGEVFRRTCRAPFLQVALPIFEQPVERQPATVVDVGCGDGTLLETLYSTVCATTRRGRSLGTRPLRMVGVEPSAVARRVTGQRLRAAGVPHEVIDGDIADPDGLRRTLTALGLDPDDALYVCKSVIHDRPFEDPGGPGEASAPPAMEGAAFVAPDGAAIPPGRMAENLAALFASWRELTRRHGFLVIEAHSVPPTTAAGLVGRTMATTFDATHGYSGQYPVPPEVFRWAAETAGFTSGSHREIGAGTVGHTVLTIDHFTVRSRGTPTRRPSVDVRRRDEETHEPDHRDL